MEEPREGTAPAQEFRSLGWIVFRSPLALFILGVPIYLATLFFLLGTGLSALDFWYSRHARMLHLLLAFYPMLWGLSFVVFLRHFRSHPSIWPRAWEERLVVVLCATLCALLTALPFLIQFKNPEAVLPMNLDVLTGVPDWRGKVLLMTLVGAANAALLSGSLFGVHIQLLRCRREAPPRDGESQGESLEEELRRYQQLRSQLGQFLSLSAAPIGLSILCLGVFRNLPYQGGPPLSEMIPVSVFMGYGLYFSGLLASIYLPAHRTLTLVGEALAKRLVQQSLPARTRWTEWTEEQQAVRTHLGLQGSALQDLQQGLTVLSPLLASLSSLLLGESG